MKLKIFLIQMLTNLMIGMRIWTENGRLLLFPILFVNPLPDVENGRGLILIILYTKENGSHRLSITLITRENGSRRKL